ncbi:unnamed protein product, partial [Brenthis ino]
MEEIMKVLKTIQDDIKIQKLEITNIKEAIVEEMNSNINKKFENLERKTQGLEKVIEEQKTIIDKMENQLKRRNVIFFGLEKKEKQYKELEEKIISIINTSMKIPCEKRDIEYVKRIGVKKDGKIRPVLITTNTMGLKIDILRKYLKERGLYIKEDYTQKVLQRRKELQEEYRSRKQNGEKIVMRRDKIVTLYTKQENNLFIKEYNHTNTNKRKPIFSPETEKTPKRNILNTAKKNKTLESYLVSPSTSNLAQN